MENLHPLAKWLKARNERYDAFSERLGRSQACVSRWIAGIRIPSALDQEKIANLTEGDVPVSVWHLQALARQQREAA